MKANTKTKVSLDMAKWMVENYQVGHILSKADLLAIQQIVERNEVLEEALSKLYEQTRELGLIL